MFKLDPGITKHYAQIRDRIAERRRELESMDEAELADSLEYCLRNTVWSGRHAHAITTYEDAVISVYIPELLRRLRGKDEHVSYPELQRRVAVQKGVA